MIAILLLLATTVVQSFAILNLVDRIRKLENKSGEWPADHDPGPDRMAGGCPDNRGGPEQDREQQEWVCSTGARRTLGGLLSKLLVLARSQ